MILRENLVHDAIHTGNLLLERPRPANDEKIGLRLWCEAGDYETGFELRSEEISATAGSWGVFFSFGIPVSLRGFWL